MTRGELIKTKIMLRRHIPPKQLPGFSIGEVILAAAVITVGVLTALSLLYSSRSNERGNRDYVVGTQLAQEGAEIVRNIRDNDFAAGGSGFEVATSNADELFDPTVTREHCLVNLSGSKWSTGARIIDQYLGNTRMCRSNCNATLRANAVTNAVVLNGIAYKRYVNIERTTAPDTVSVVSFVYWGTWAPADSSGFASNAAYVTAMKSQCNRVNKCVYSEAEVLGWK